MIILHNKYDAVSRDFVEQFSQGNLVIDWYGDTNAQLQYRLSNQPIPTAFPFVVYEGQGFRNPESIQWVIDEVAGSHLTIQQKLDAMIKLSKLDILEALDELPVERAKFDVLMQDAKFAERWVATTDLDMEHPLTVAAVEAVDMDVDAVKRKIKGV